MISTNPISTEAYRKVDILNTSAKFTCGACGQYKKTLGRRTYKVAGSGRKRYACADCVPIVCKVAK